MKVRRICEWCGKQFYIKQSALKRGRGKFCSKECYSKWQSENLGGENSPHYKGLTSKCLFCGKLFPTWESKLKKEEAHFCSRECMGKWYSEHHKGKNNPRYKEQIKTNCHYCGCDIYLHECRVGTRNFCSKECSGKWKSEYYKGENNPCWRGGIKYEPYCEKFNDEFKERIRDKFNRVCFICGKPEEKCRRKLCIHHVNYSKDCLCSDNITCQFVPLCDSCHAKTNFNRECWEEYIMSKLRSRLDGYYI